MSNFLASDQLDPNPNGLYRYSTSDWIWEIRLEVVYSDRQSSPFACVSGDIYRNSVIHSLDMVRLSWRLESPEVLITSDFSFQIRRGQGRLYSNEGIETVQDIILNFEKMENSWCAKADIWIDGREEQVSGFEQVSTAFRQIALSLSVCHSVAHGITWPFLPQTALPPGMHKDFPNGFRVKDALALAGVEVWQTSEQTLLDESAGDDGWSKDELNQLMEQSMASRSDHAAWHIWGLLAGRFNDECWFGDGVGKYVAGIMFDFNNSNQWLERQGFAVFKTHHWFEDLNATASDFEPNQIALRRFFHTFTHEIGHIFNLRHSWEDNPKRENSTSWMNYFEEGRYSGSEQHFWQRCDYQFDDVELLRLRHYPVSNVIPGGSAFGINWAQSSDHANPLKLSLYSKPVFDFMEPVWVSLQLVNISDDQTLSVNTLLHPSYGFVRFYYREKNQTEWIRIESPDCLLASPRIQKLASKTVGKKQPSKNSPFYQPDRYTEYIPLFYSKQTPSGFLFSDQPGEYEICAIYLYGGKMLISNICPVKIEMPHSTAWQILAQDYFNQEVAINLYLGGSSAQYLQSSWDVIRAVEDFSKFEKRMEFGVHIASVLSKSEAANSVRLTSTNGPVSIRREKPKPTDIRKALELTDPYLEYFIDTPSIGTIMPFYHLMTRYRFPLLLEVEKKQLQTELDHLILNLQERKGGAIVLNALQYWIGIGSEKQQ